MFLSRTLLPLATAALLAAAPAPASPPVWEFDPVHTRIAFAVDHAGFSRSLGTFSGVTGTLVFDPEQPAQAQVQVEVPVDGLDFGDERWNRAALAGNLLDAATHPVARFRSTRVEPLDDGRTIVHGVLELRGVSREIRLDATINAVRRHPLPPFRRTAGFSATATLSRADFGISAWRSLIGDAVELRIEAEATRMRDPGPATDPAPAQDESDPAPDIEADPET